MGAPALELLHSLPRIDDNPYVFPGTKERAHLVGLQKIWRSPTGGHLDPAQVHRIVKAAARGAELPAAVSAHWLRHAHAER